VQWVANEIATRFGFRTLYNGTAAIVLALAAIFTVMVWRGSRAQIGPWLLTVALIVGAWAGLTGNNVELVHYPQYFPEGVALAALTLSPVEALSWVVFFGGLDEAYQFWLLPRTRVSLYDFNDIYMDLLGGAAGVIFAIAVFHLPLRRGWKRPGLILILSLITIGFLLWASGLMVVVADKTNPHYWFALGDFQAPSFWAHINENGPKHYDTMTPIEGVILILSTIGLYGALTRRRAA